MPWSTVSNAALRSVHVNAVILFDSMDHRMSLVILIMAVFTAEILPVSQLITWHQLKFVTVVIESGQNNLLHHFR